MESNSAELGQMLSQLQEKPSRLSSLNLEVWRLEYKNTPTAGTNESLAKRMLFCLLEYGETWLFCAQFQLNAEACAQIKWSELIHIENDEAENGFLAGIPDGQTGSCAPRQTQQSRTEWRLCAWKKKWPLTGAVEP